MNEPINDCRELNEGEKRNGKFLVSGTEAPVAFETAEEVFDFVAPPVVAAVKGHWPPGPTKGWQGLWVTDGLP
jgi:hypothetical protein